MKKPLQIALNGVAGYMDGAHQQGLTRLNLETVEVEQYGKVACKIGR